MCKFDQCLHTFRKSGTNTYAICVYLIHINTLHKRNTKTYATCVNFSTLWTFCTRILNTSNTICVNIGTFYSLFALSTEKFTQPTKILRDRRSHQSRKIWFLLSGELINICGLSEGLIAIGFLFLFFQIICSCCQPGGVVAKCAWLTWPLSRKPFSCLSSSPEMSWDPLFGPSLDSTKALPAHNRVALQMKTHWREQFKVYTNQRAWTVGNSYLQWMPK